jgi:hypothetical protein
VKILLQNPQFSLLCCRLRGVSLKTEPTVNTERGAKQEQSRTNSYGVARSDAPTTKTNSSAMPRVLHKLHALISRKSVKFERNLAAQNYELTKMNTK